MRLEADELVHVKNANLAFVEPNQPLDFELVQRERSPAVCDQREAIVALMVGKLKVTLVRFTELDFP